MSYIGNQPTSIAFLTDQFSGDGSTVAFTMSVAPASTSSILVAVTGVVQDPSTYSIVGTTLTFSAAPPSGTGNISVRYLGIPASGVTTTAYRTVTEFTATSGQTTFTPPSYTVGYIDVYRNGSRLGAADYTASNGTTVVLAAAATAGDLVTTESFYVSSVLNAIPATAGAVNSTYLAANLTLTTPTIAQINSASSATPTIFADSSGTQVGTLCRAWVNFNGTGTVAIRASFNVSSITDNGTGDYTINFTTAMPDTNYAVAGMADSYATGQSYSGSVMINKSSTYSTSAVRVIYGFGNGASIYDTEKICVTVFR